MIHSYFHSWQAFWQMGGYARYVWPAYLLVLVVMLWQRWHVRRQHRLLRGQQEKTTHA